MLQLLADASSPVDWRAWLTPENLISALSAIAAIFGFLGRSKYRRIAVAIIAGVEAYRRNEETPPGQSAGIAAAIRSAADAVGVESALNPLVQEITRPNAK